MNEPTPKQRRAQENAEQFAAEHPMLANIFFLAMAAAVLAFIVWFLVFAFTYSPAPETSKYVPPKSEYATAMEYCVNNAWRLMPSVGPEQRATECVRIVDEALGR